MFAWPRRNLEQIIMSEEGKSTPDSRKWDKDIAPKEKITGGKVDTKGMGGATGCESPNTLQHRKFGKHGPE